MNLKAFKKLVKEKKESLTRKDIFDSEEYRKIAQAETDAITFGLEAKIKEFDFYDKLNSITAYSTGGEITLNLGTTLLEEEEDLGKAMLMATGLRAHECGHELFTDGPTWVKYFRSLYNDIENIKAHKNSLWKTKFKKELEGMIQDFEKYPNKKDLFLNIAKDVQNRFEDAFVNNGIYSLHAGDPTIGLKALNDKNFETEENYEDFISSIVSGEKNVFEFLIIYLHAEACGYEFKKNHKELSKDEREIDDFITNFLNDLKEERQQLPWEGNITKRCNLLTNVLVKLYSLVKLPEPQDNKSGSGNGESDNKENEGDSKGDSKGSSNNNSGNSSKSSSSSSGGEEKNEATQEEIEKALQKALDENKIEKLLEEIQETLKNNPSSSSCLNTSDAIVKLTLDKNKQEKTLSISEDLKKKLEEKLSKVVEKVAEEEATNEMEEKHRRELKDEVNKIHNAISENHYHIGLQFSREECLQKEIVEQDLKEVNKEIYFLVRRLSTILKDREVDELERRFFSGNKVFAKDAITSKKVFARHNEPTGKPNLRVCILVDESGSMNATFDKLNEIKRYEFARKKAILLHQVLKKLDIPHQIVGHTGDMNDVIIYNYVDYDTVDGKDLYRLGNIYHRRGNRDGAAITQCCEKLLQYPEKKLLIVISDGLPTERGYFDEDPLIDTVEAVHRYSKKGVTIIGTLMETKNPKYEQIYGNNLLDCSTPEKFDKSLVKLIQKFVLK